MPITDVKVWLQVANGDLAMEVSEQLADLIDASIVRPGVQLRGITQERPSAACGEACEGPRRIEGTITIAPSGDILICTDGGRQIGLADFLREDCRGKAEGSRIAVEVL
ncbi:MAG: hypothetical protein HY675_18245 [Chloroflexi bacterium]|nr:hypothetical protein [Chloroflexota bacterium]